MAWFDMPMPVLASYARNLPRLQAGESLLSVAEARIAGAGQMKYSQARQATSRIEREAHGHQKRPANPQRLRAAGIAVEHRKARR